MTMLKRRAKVAAVAACTVLAATTVTPAMAQPAETSTATTQAMDASAHGSLDELTKVLQLSTAAVGGVVAPIMVAILHAFDRLGCAIRNESPCNVRF